LLSGAPGLAESPTLLVQIQIPVHVWPHHLLILGLLLREFLRLVLRRLRQEASLTQEELGFEADLRRTYVSVLELGQQQPSLTTILKLSKALKLSASELMSLTEAELTEN